MPSAASQLIATEWLVENGPRELERLFRTMVYHPSEPALIIDDDRNCRGASSGAGKLFGVSRDEIIGRTLDDLLEPSFKPKISSVLPALMEQGEQKGTLPIVGRDGNLREMEYAAKRDVLPARHLLLLRDKTAQPAPEKADDEVHNETPSWVQDYAFFLLNANGEVAAWYSGAERTYGYTSAELVGKQVALLYPCDDALHLRLREELKRSTSEGHFGSECWCARKDGTRFWANVLTIALKDESGELQGFARVVRDFTGRQEWNENRRRTRAGMRPIPAETTIAAIVSGEFDRLREANDAFLELAGYTRDDLLAGRLSWPDLTPPEYFAMDEAAHEEALLFGACTPFESELLRQDGTRIPVLIATAVLELSPFRWITFVQDLRDQGGQRSIENEVVDLKHDFVEIIGRSAAVKRILGQVELVAPTNATVLILGETGTGKELIARAIHRMSTRRDRPFITLNCAAIPTGLLESELFGYERGAFTGALSQKIGRFELAHRGTLFLDEVGDIPLDLQPKLLRALQEKSFERLGGTRTIPIDVRLVAATNRNLTQMMGDKLFRSDLYYRLKVFPITTPPLRDHPEDIPVLARHFTQKYAREMNKQIETIPVDTMQALVKWPWPGNVRELENFIERAVILSHGPNLRAPLAEIRPDASVFEGNNTLEEVERVHITRMLRETGGVVSKAAARLGMPRTTLNALMRKLGISRKNL